MDDLTGLMMALDELDRIGDTDGEWVRVTRCKDCRHWRSHGLCGIWDNYISNGDFYCGCAERREDE